MSEDKTQIRKLCSDLAKATMPDWPFTKKEKPSCCSTHCERSQECRSPNECCGNFPLPKGVRRRVKP